MLTVVAPVASPAQTLELASKACQGQRRQLIANIGKSMT